MRYAVLLPGVAALLCAAPPAPADTAGPATSCHVLYDRAVARIEQEAAALRAMLDADAAVVDAPVYRLSETEEDLMADLSAARSGAAADYRACLARARPAAR